ncbi:HDOD domain-containing protein [Variovorax sp. J31P179]|uniref:EAL and HDOD domain-containing protein n=1 Tax=Variovorax sp. J31P179 TaxID=3053508 RepID=UPI0025791C4D|nr:HDOD domain-containing protein [Variovorax sp. J31P179]MDM0085165.1 HDOD domain-containing protein [Variovorax sp. J31P179]
MRFDFFRTSGAAAANRKGDAGMPAQSREEPVDELGGPREASGYVRHALQLDPQQRVKGYRMAWLATPGAAPTPDASSQFIALLDNITRHLNPPRTGWRLGRLVLFLDVTVDGLFLAELQSLPPENVVLCMGLGDLSDVDTRSMLLFLREQGFGFMLKDADGLPADPELREIITHLDVGDGDPERVARVRAEEQQGRAPVQLIATRIDTWAQAGACADLRVDIFVDGALAHPPVKEGGDALQPESVMIVRLMHMIQRNENVRSIESALKRDAALTYRLLRHINSPAIGAGVEIHSLRHAVAMLGYAPLFRWLSVLLATSNRAAAPFMTKKAITRGRFVELMGQGMLPPGEADNLFVVGMFSLIDQLLGVPMTEVLAKVQLAGSVQQAILAREGVYAPFLALAEACETDAAQAARLSEALFVGSGQVNAAHLAAMVWSQEADAHDAS